MGDRTTNEMENLSLRADTKLPRDFLQIFTSGRRSDPDEDLGSGEDVELNLGLSLGGRFGVDKSNNNNNKLVRSSSVATILPVVRDDDVLVSRHNNININNNNPGGSYSGLTRTTSLPVETEEEWRKRKELQSLRRLAAKRRRSEKQNNNNNNNNSNLAKGEYVAAIKRQGSRGETSSPLQESSKPPSSPAGIGGRKNSIGLSEEMPCVFTQGDGPNGRVVEGILYKYGKGEQVKIMCVCHGSFLSPAEFVKHAGGTDFVHPLKHIVVKPSSSF